MVLSVWIRRGQARWLCTVAVAGGGVLLSITPTPAASMPGQIDSVAMSQVDALFAREAKRHLAGGITVGVVLGPELVWTKSYGFANAAARTPATRRTVYRIGSITKQLTAIMLLQLVEQGTVQLTDPVEKYYPDLRSVAGLATAVPPITLLEIATHRAGLSRDADGDEFHQGAVNGWESRLRSAMPHVSFTRSARDNVNYSNIGYAVLGAALGNASGQSYVTYVREHILQPLGRSDTTFEPTAELRKRLARGYEIAGNRADASAAEEQLRNGRGYAIPNGGLFSTVDDLATILSFEMGDGPPNVLKASTIRANMAQTYSAGFGRRTGLGFFVHVFDGHTSIGYAGHVTGYIAAAFFDPKSKIGLVYLQNFVDAGGEFDLDRLVLKPLATLSAADRAQ